MMKDMLEKDLRDHAVKQLREAVAVYKSDLLALPVDALGVSPGGAARAPFDFTYEVIVVNQRVVSRLKGEDPGPWPFEGWATAPADMRDATKLIEALEATANDVDAALVGDIRRPVAMGSETKEAYQMAYFAGMHVMYHDAQLNQIQGLLGDTEMHW